MGATGVLSGMQRAPAGVVLCHVVGSWREEVGGGGGGLCGGLLEEREEYVVRGIRGVGG